jgi:hypothetical protein
VAESNPPGQIPALPTPRNSQGGQPSPSGKKTPQGTNDPSPPRLRRPNYGKLSDEDILNL